MAVTYLLAIHKVADFTKWKMGYGDSLPTRQKAGLKEKYLLRSIDDPNEVILLHEAEDIQKVKEFTSSPDLRERMQQSGVLGEPTGTFSVILARNLHINRRIAKLLTRARMTLMETEPINCQQVA
jgi:hypothetical protein